MTNFDIRINIKMLSNHSGYLNISKDKKLFYKLVGSFAHYVLRLYKLMIKEDMHSNRYKGVWEPIEERGYIEYLGVIPQKNIYDILCESLEVAKIGYNYIIRVNPYDKYPKTKIPLSRVIRAIEHGTSKFNSRPLLASISREINKNILELWRGYLSMRGVT